MPADYEASSSPYPVPTFSAMFVSPAIPPRSGLFCLFVGLGAGLFVCLFGWFVLFVPTDVCLERKRYVMLLLYSFERWLDQNFLRVNCLGSLNTGITRGGAHKSREGSNASMHQS